MLLATVVTACGMAIVSLDTQGVITSWNPAAERLFGVTAAVALNRPFRPLVPAEQDSGWRGYLAQVAASGAPQIRDTQGCRPDGCPAATELVTTTMHDAHGTIFGYVIVARDISQQVRAQAAMSDLVNQLQTANDALIQANAVKTDLVATISHEFRTPLTSIQGFSELLETEPLAPAEIRSFARTITESARRLGRMIRDQLDLETLESGHWPMRRTAVNLNALVERVMSTMQAVATAHWFVTDLPPDLPMVEGDADLLERVITNVVANAVKYSPAGGPITLTTGQDDDEVTLSVADLGLGIPEEDRDRIFAPYARVGRPEHQRVDGTGLGLPIARKILEAHDGRIWVEPNTPRGSIFRIRVPAAGSGPERA